MPFTLLLFRRFESLINPVGSKISFWTRYSRRSSLHGVRGAVSRSRKSIKGLTVFELACASSPSWDLVRFLRSRCFVFSGALLGVSGSRCASLLDFSRLACSHDKSHEERIGNDGWLRKGRCSVVF